MLLYDASAKNRQESVSTEERGPARNLAGVGEREWSDAQNGGTADVQGGAEGATVALLASFVRVPFLFPFLLPSSSPCAIIFYQMKPFHVPETTRLHICLI